MYEEAAMTDTAAERMRETAHHIVALYTTSLEVDPSRARQQERAERMVRRIATELREAEARARRAALEEAARWHDEQARIFVEAHPNVFSRSIEWHRDCAAELRALAASPAAATPFDHPWRSYVTWVEEVERVLREARQYVSDAEDDEDPETRDHASSLLGDIDMALNLTPTPPDEAAAASSPWREIAEADPEKLCHVAKIVSGRVVWRAFAHPSECSDATHFYDCGVADLPSPPASEALE
jgi:DNA-binding ferritin-like protein